MSCPLQPAAPMGLLRALCAIAAFVTAAAAPGPVFAQSSPPAPTSATPWDGTVLVGLLSGRPPSVPDSRSYSDDWFNTAEAGAVLGRHLTPHVKAELELWTSAEGRRFVEHYVQPPNYPYPVPVGADQFTRVHEVSAALTYQFFENEWVHPFVQIGAAMDVDRLRTHTWPQSFYTGDPRLPGSQVVAAAEGGADHATTIRGRAIVGVGAKWYATPRIFVRTDARFAAGRGGQHLALRAGVGVDF